MGEAGMDSGQHKCRPEEVARYLPSWQECVSAATIVNGVCVATDYLVKVFHGNTYVGSLVGTLEYIADAAAGLLIHNGIIGFSGGVIIKKLERVSEDTYTLSVEAIDNRIDKTMLPVDAPVSENIILNILRIFLTVSSKRLCPYATHAIYVAVVEPEIMRPFSSILLFDTSRHTVSLKALGLLSRLAGTGMLSGKVLVAFVTGRVASDMVDVLAKAGVRIIVSNHHPLLSGISAATKNNVTLVLRRLDNRGLAVYTNPERILDRSTIGLIEL